MMSRAPTSARLREAPDSDVRPAAAARTAARLWWRAPGVSLYVGDARGVLRGLPAGSVDCVVTSPPYWGLRDYRVAGQYGGEPTLDAYVRSVLGVFDEIARVLHPAGTVWVNLGDTYGGSWGNYIAPGSTTRTAGVRVAWAQGSCRPPQTRARAKDLQGVPWRAVFALTEHGWWLREAIVWSKPNARPESVRDRLAQRYEMVFALARSARHWWMPDGPSAHDGDSDVCGDDVVGGVWTIPTSRSRSGHIAPGPVALAARCIRTGCPPGGRVLDPFSGSGTTGVAARGLGRSFVGIDLDPASHVLARQRLSQTGSGR